MSRVRPDHPRCGSSTWICMCCHTHDVVTYSKFHRTPFWGFRAQGGENLPFPLLWLSAFATAGTCIVIPAAIFLLYSLACSESTPANPFWRSICRMMFSAQGSTFWGLIHTALHFGGQIPQTLSFWGVIDWVRALHSTQHNIGLFGDVLPANVLAKYWRNYTKKCTTTASNTRT